MESDDKTVCPPDSPPDLSVLPHSNIGLVMSNNLESNLAALVNENEIVSLYNKILTQELTDSAKHRVIDLLQITFARACNRQKAQYIPRLLNYLDIFDRKQTLLTKHMLLVMLIFIANCDFDERLPSYIH